MQLSPLARLVLRLVTYTVLGVVYLPLALIFVLSFNSAKSIAWPPVGFSTRWWEGFLDVESAREAWGLATMCGVAGKGELLEVIPRFLITGRRVTGSSFGGVKGRTQVPLLVDRWLNGEIDVEALLSHRISLDEVNRGFELMEAQDGIRSVITFG